MEDGSGAGDGECLRPGAHGVLPGAQRRSAAALPPAMQQPAGSCAQRLLQLHAGWQQPPLLSRLGAADSAARINITSSWPRLRPTGSDSPPGQSRQHPPPALTDCTACSTCSAKRSSVEACCSSDSATPVLTMKPWGPPYSLYTCGRSAAAAGQAGRRLRELGKKLKQAGGGGEQRSEGPQTTAQGSALGRK